MRWLIELILGPKPSVKAQSEATDRAVARAMEAHREAMRLRLEVITRGGGKHR